MRKVILISLVMIFAILFTGCDYGVEPLGEDGDVEFSLSGVYFCFNANCNRIYVCNDNFSSAQILIEHRYESGLGGYWNTCYSGTLRGDRGDYVYENIDVGDEFYVEVTVEGNYNRYSFDIVD